MVAVQDVAWGKLAPRFVGPFEIVERIGPVAYRLRLPQELSCIHDVFHVSNLKKCLAESDIQIPLEEIRVNDKVYFIEEPVEIVDRQGKKLKRSWIPIVKVRWDSRRGAEFTWEREDQFKAKSISLKNRCPLMYSGCGELDANGSVRVIMLNFEDGFSPQSPNLGLLFSETKKVENEEEFEEDPQERHEEEVGRMG
ncbi:hypothetical protein Tco_1253379 [Tanacetum coccineum]